MYLHLRDEWWNFRYDAQAILAPLSSVRAKQGLIVGEMGSLGFSLQNDAMLTNLWFIDCLEKALDSTSETLSKVRLMAKFWERHSATKLNDRQTKLINMLFDGFVGKLSSSKWAKIAKCSSDTALNDINDLVRKGILKKNGEGGRSTSYSLVLPE